MNQDTEDFKDCVLDRLDDEITCLDREIIRSELYIQTCKNTISKLRNLKAFINHQAMTEDDES